MIFSEVLSSRIRISRNLASQPFLPSSGGMLEEIAHRLKVMKGPWNSWEFQGVGDLEPGFRQRLLEKGLLEPEFALSAQGGFALSPDQSRILTWGDRDHLRVAGTTPGLGLTTLWTSLEPLVQALETAFPPAFHPDFGYLSSDPRQCGTGVKPSVLFHLPACDLTGLIQEVFKQAEGQGYSVRGWWESEGEEGCSLYQVSPYFTTGLGEDSSFHQLEHLSEKIAAYEAQARTLLMSQQALRVKDLVGRAEGILRYGLKLSFPEGALLVSRLRLGVLLGIIEKVDLGTFTALWQEMQKAHLGTVDDPDVQRARLVRSRLGYPER